MPTTASNFTVPAGSDAISTIDDTFATFAGQIANLRTNAQSGTGYTLALTDAYYVVELSNAAAITLTVPTNASVAFPIGTQINLIQTGAGQVTVQGAGGVTVNANGSRLKLSGQWAVATLIKRGTDTWLLLGNTTV